MDRLGSPLAGTRDLYRSKSNSLSMRVLLVEPDYYTRYPPLGLLKIAQLERSRGNAVRLVRGCREEPQPDYVYVTSLFTYSWRAVHQAVKYYQTRLPQVPAHLRGLYAWLLPAPAA